MIGIRLRLLEVYLRPRLDGIGGLDDVHACGGEPGEGIVALLGEVDHAGDDHGARAILLRRMLDTVGTRPIGGLGLHVRHAEDLGGARAVEEGRKWELFHVVGLLGEVWGGSVLAARSDKLQDFRGERVVVPDVRIGGGVDGHQGVAEDLVLLGFRCELADDQSDLFSGRHRAVHEGADAVGHAVDVGRHLVALIGLGSDQGTTRREPGSGPQVGQGFGGVVLHGGAARKGDDGGGEEHEAQVFVFHVWLC